MLLRFGVWEWANIVFKIEMEKLGMGDNVAGNMGTDITWIFSVVSLVQFLVCTIYAVRMCIFKNLMEVYEEWLLQEHRHFRFRVLQSSKTHTNKKELWDVYKYKM